MGYERQAIAPVTPPWIPALTATAVALGLGLLSLRSPTSSICLAAIVFVLGITNGELPLLARLILVLTLAVPATRLSVSPLLAALPIVMTCFVVLNHDNLNWSGSRVSPVRGTPFVFLSWTAVSGVLFLEGVRSYGVSAAFFDLERYAAYAWIIVPLIVMRRGLVRLVLLGVALYGLVSLGVFAVPSLRAWFFEGTQYASSYRVGFGNLDLAVLVLPLALVLSADLALRWQLRLGMLTTAAVVAASLLVSQSRAALIAAGTNVVLAFAAPSLGNRLVRWRLAFGFVAVAACLVAVLFAASLLGSKGARSLPTQLTSRAGAIWNYSQDYNYRGRQRTNAVNTARWMRDSKSVLLGDGLGASLGNYVPDRVEPKYYAPFVDNAWVTVAVKGGLLGVASLGLLVAAAFVTIVRAARRTTEKVQRLIWRTLAIAFPVFVFESTWLTSHMLTTPSIAVGIATLVAAAKLEHLGHV